MAAKRLTDRKLKALKPAAKGKRYDVPDGDVRGLAVRVTDKGQRSFVLVARFPGSTNPTRRALGVYPTLTLESARNKARAWHDLIAKGIDPKEHERREAEENKRQAAAEQANTFGAVAERYIAQHLKGQRRARDAER